MHTVKIGVINPNECGTLSKITWFVTYAGVIRPLLSGNVIYILKFYFKVVFQSQIDPAFSKLMNSIGSVFFTLLTQTN